MLLPCVAPWILLRKGPGDVRDMGKLVNEPLEQEVDELSENISKLRRVSVQVLQLQERRRTNSDYNPKDLEALVAQINEETKQESSTALSKWKTVGNRLSGERSTNICTSDIPYNQNLFW